MKESKIMRLKPVAVGETHWLLPALDSHILAIGSLVVAAGSRAAALPAVDTGSNPVGRSFRTLENNDDTVLEVTSVA
jgi:hypothetical protein